MRGIALLAAGGFLALVTTPSVGQIIRPNLPTPPCSTGSCVSHPRGARTQQFGAPSLQKRGCPQGTKYDAYKGTCRVMPASH